jgi:predicted N-acetyltransferase YhbS/anti-sigma regulatory factor (Ser/Thr protein kinase)
MEVSMQCLLQVPARADALGVVQSLARTLADSAGFDARRIDLILLACEEAFAGIVSRCTSDSTEPVHISADLSGLSLAVEFHDREAPPAPEEDAPVQLDVDGPGDPALSGLGRLLIRSAADEALWESLGRDGNRLRLVFNRPRADVAESAPTEQLQRYDRSAPLAPEQPYTIRLAGARDDDWFQISRAMFRAYGYTHPCDDLYFPERVRELNRSQRLVSVVATTESGEVVGHYALELAGVVQQAGGKSSSAETGFAVVDPAHRSRGLMERMRELIEAQARAHGLSGVFGQPVTTHVFSQRVNERFGSRVCALSLALASDNIRFRAIERKAPAQRESTLMYFKLLVDPPRRRTYAPAQHRDFLLETYAECAIPVEVLAEPALADQASAVSAQYVAMLDLGLIRVTQVGPDIGQALRLARNELVRQAGTRVILLSVRLSRPGCSAACDAAERLGFFYSGLGPFFDEGEDVLRLQYVDVPLDTGALQLASPFAHRLLKYIEADRARVEHG